MTFDTALNLLPGLVIGLTVHEAAHAISAKWLGDRTAEKMGRISLNPLRHLSLYGTLALFFLGFGWGKPVIVNLYNFKKPKFYYLLSSLAGPVSNLMICGICLGVLYIHPSRMVFKIFVPVFLINGMLAAINLVPVPPLDGSKIWPCLIPGMKPTISGKWSLVWVVVLIVSLQTGGLDMVLGPVFNGMYKILPDSRQYSGAIKTKRPEGFPKVLIEPKKAQDIFYDNSDPDQFMMFFNVNETMTGMESYDEIESSLRKFDWQKLKYGFIEPEIAHNSDWKEIEHDNKEIVSYSCVDVWVNLDGRLIMLSRVYNCYNDKELDDTYGFFINYFSSSDEGNSTLDKYKQLHPEEFLVLE